MSTIRVETVRDARDHFSEGLDRDEATIITHNGLEVAAAIPVEDLRYYQDLENRELARLVQERLSTETGPLHTYEATLQETLARD